MEIDKTMDEVAQLEDEYAVQYFGFLPQSFMNGIYNLICEYLKEAMGALNDTIINKFKDKIPENEIQEVSQELRMKAVERLDEKFDKAEHYLLNNVFKLPDHVILPEDNVQVESPCSEEEMNQLDQDIQNCIDRINMVRMANLKIRTRMEKIDQLQEQFDSTLDSVTRIRSEVHSQSSKVLQTVTDLGNIQKELQELEMY